MELNRRIIEILRDSEIFKRSVSVFIPQKPYFNWAMDCYSFVTQLHPEYMNPSEMARNSEWYSNWLESHPSLIEGLNGAHKKNAFERIIDDLQAFARGKTENYRFKSFKAEMDAFSLALYSKCSFCKPVLYPYRYDIFENNCKDIGITLPEPPITKNYRDYFLFYYDICLALNQFQTQKQLSDAEICAVVYGLEQEREFSTENLPDPTHIWLLGASGKEDFKRLADTNNPHPVIWQGNERSCRGDLVLVYCLAPYSAIKYVYHVVAEGIFNPFDKYQARIAICKGVKVPEITLDDIKEKFAHLKIVKKNMQGLNGVSFPITDYLNLIKIWENRGFNIKQLPILTTSEELNVEINSEDDVYNLIVDRIVPRLGYNSGEWKGGSRNQLMLQYGRNRFGKPDYVFFPHGDHLNERAPFVIEAKEAFKNIRQFNKDFSQGYAYAKNLHAKYLGLCDKDELIIIEGYNGEFNMNYIRFRRSWADIFSKDAVFMELKALVGREEIIKLI